MDWEKRVDALKKIRSLLLLDTGVFIHFVKEMSIAFLDILKELRSQVIREACISIAYMSKVLKTRVDTFFTYILQELINLVPNSVKVIASSGTIALKFVVKYTHLPKLIPILTSNIMQSKSKDIRATLSEILGIVFEDWSPKSMERFANNIKDCLMKGICDADNDARRFNRKYGHFVCFFFSVQNASNNNCAGDLQEFLGISTALSRFGRSNLQQCRSKCTKGARPGTRRNRIKRNRFDEC